MDRGEVNGTGKRWKGRIEGEAQEEGEAEKEMKEE
jgi:hypothetical protein